MKVSIFHPVYTKREAELPFYITTIGTSPIQRVVYRPGGIESYQLLYTTKGCGEVKLYGETIEAHIGSLTVIPPNVTHYYTMEGEEWSTLWITFSGYGAKRLLDIEGTVVEVPRELDFEGKFNTLLNLRRSEAWNLQSSALLYSLILECKELIPEKSVSAYKMRNQLRESLAYIHGNYMNVIELSHLAKLSGVSREHYCRLFRQYTGMRPVEYITKIRLQKARELLDLNCDMPISSIAKETGFQSNSYFSAVFRKNFGQSAEEYKKRENITTKK